MKTCSKCGIEKPFEDYFKDKRAKDGLHSHCKECHRLETKKYRIGNVEKIKIIGKEYRDSHKEQIKEYYIKNSELFKKQKKVYYLENIDVIKANRGKYYLDNKEKCKNRRKKYYWENRELISEKSKQYRIDNKEKLKKTDRESYLKNREKNKERAKIYTSNNRVKINKQKREYTQKRRDDDPNYRLINSVRASIYDSLKGNKNGHHWEDLVGYNKNELMIHLEAQFKDGMSWQNYGKKGWVVDHIIPVSLFNITGAKSKGFKKCWKLNNLQPMWEKENSKKSNILFY